MRTVFGAQLESENSGDHRGGFVLGNRYELVRVLGEGGTGVVWAAHDRVLNLEVAVKLLQHSDSPNDDFVRRAQVEARSAAKLSHPAVCRALDFGFSSSGAPFIVSELLGGESLEEAIAREGRLEATQAVRMLLPILDALRAAHETGIVHRDVKPANIFLAREGTTRLSPKLVDFGIAHWLGDPRVTHDGSVCGTPDYMSPEQASGSDDIDGRSDLWNFCATLYEALTGVVPFRGDDYAAVLWAVQNVDPEPITAFCAGDDALATIVACGLWRNRALRWQSAAELADALCRWLLGRGVETDICDHSLRARLLERQNTVHEPGALARVRRGASVSKRRFIAVGAGAALVALASSFQALRADDRHVGSPAPKSALAEVRIVDDARSRASGNEVEGLRAAVAAPTERNTQPDGAIVAALGTPPSAPASPLHARGAQALASPNGYKALPRVAPAPPSPRRRSGNALKYDFGL